MSSKRSGDWALTQTVKSVDLNYMFFTQEIKDWRSWGDVFCSTSAFFTIVGAIFICEGLGEPAPLENLTPGSSAVFRSGKYVVKLFAPKESGVDPVHDYNVECAMLDHAKRSGVPAPTLVSRGVFTDTYQFYYIIMDYIQGKPAGELLPAFTTAEKGRFVGTLVDLLRKLRQPCECLMEADYSNWDAAENPRLDTLPKPLADDIRARIARLPSVPCVTVHGDITGDNVLIDDSGRLYVIDFADSLVAPGIYEWPPIVFGLLRCDTEAVRFFMNGMPVKTFVETLLSALAMHRFSANIILDFAAQEHIDLSIIQNLEALGKILLAKWL